MCRMCKPKHKQVLIILLSKHTFFWFWVYTAPPIVTNDTVLEFQAIRWVTHPMVLFIWVTHVRQTWYLHIPKKEEWNQDGKIIQRLKAIVFKLFMARQEKIPEKNPEASIFSCIPDWNKLKTFHFFPKRRTWAHNPCTGSQISNSHFLKALLWDIANKS